ncbi:putative prophage antirepressor [Pseudomonas coronafaciens pv. garcae]|nr:putative prophage antirepressor [Pseudomonas coronafaciens pv. garcae]RMS92886.1 hypothetical protein ALP56_04957 [Pseudomonas coronafaciens pv. oryzae]RMS93405.1 putative prophage antirepressor [Pseudomonas coronafaciens pv. oryzae]RMS98814.1 putative prophage antirepressor [Pseudomonas coronafaciens pv. oryzae]RMV88447.1 hypothetical protein ALP02_05030 [Pseudomonas coronafaciens pv. garcae]
MLSNLFQANARQQREVCAGCTPTPFHRHNRQLLALLLENQP